jgi:SAM-dependent methyltransferase
MNEQFVVETDRIYTFYDNYVQNHGIAAGWATLEDANNSYQEASNCLAQKWNNFSSVLDVGSGQGHFLPYLRRQRNFKGSYTGIELLDFFHREAVKLYGSRHKLILSVVNF